MEIIKLPKNLKFSKNLESIVGQYSSKLASKIKKEISHFDEYYLISGGFVVKIFHQEFERDPWIKLSPMKEIVLVSYSEELPFETLKTVLEKYCSRILITRCSQSMLKNFRDMGFEELKNRFGEPTLLVPIEIDVLNAVSSRKRKTSGKVRKMKKTYLKNLEFLFKQEYSLRYRMVKMMYLECPEMCFVFEDKGDVLGAVFNKIEKGSLYMRQIFVKKGFRNRGIGRSLMNTVLETAKKKGITKLIGKMRNEASYFYEIYNPILIGEIEHYLIKQKIYKNRKP